MFNKQKIIEKIKNNTDRLIISKILDQANLALKYHEVKWTNFLDPYQHKLAMQHLKNLVDENMNYWGGYDDAERKIISFFPDYMVDNSASYPISVLNITCSNIEKLSHRDILGSVLGLGITREKIGDILLCDNICYVFVISDISDFILINLTKISSYNIKVEEKDIETIIIPEKRYKEISASVASLRLDSLLSVALGKSRNKVIPYIDSKRVNVNWEPSKSAAQAISKGDVISVKGKGRMVLEDVGGTTRKGRVNIIIKRFI